MPYFGPQVTKLCDFFANMVIFHVLIGFIMTNSVMEWKLDVQILNNHEKPMGVNLIPKPDIKNCHIFGHR